MLSVKLYVKMYVYNSGRGSRITESKTPEIISKLLKFLL